MAEEHKLDNDPKAKITNIEKILPKIEEKLSGREEEQVEYENIKNQMSTLRRNYEDTEEKYFRSKNEISKINKRAIKLYLQVKPSLFTRFLRRTQHNWRVSRTIFFIQLILIALLVMIAVTAFFQNNDLQTLLLESGFTLIIILIFIRIPKYRYFSGFSILAMFLFIYVNFVTNESLRWTLLSMGITLVAIGIAFHTFRTGESLEQKVDKIEGIENKLDEILNRMPKQPKEEHE